MAVYRSDFTTLPVISHVIEIRQGKPKLSKVVKTVVANWDRLIADHDFAREHRKRLRISNVVVSAFPRLRLRTAASRRFNSQINAACLI